MRLPVSVVTAALATAVVATSASAEAQSSAPGQFGGAPPGQFQPPAPTTPAPGTPAAPPPDAFGGMNAGGLAPPPPSTDEPAPVAWSDDEPASTDEELDRSKEEDAGRGLTWFWIEAGGGFEHVGLATLDDHGISGGLFDTTGSGAVVDAGMGARLLFLTLGARGRMGFFDAWNLARIGGEVGLRIPIGRIEPRADLGVGYAALTGVTSPTGRSLETDTDGIYGRLGAGLDVFARPWLAVGGGVSWEVLRLSHTTVTVPSGAPGQPRPDASGSTFEAWLFPSSGVGSTVAITARVGLQF